MTVGVSASTRRAIRGRGCRQRLVCVVVDGFVLLSVQAYGEGLEEGRDGRSGESREAWKLDDPADSRDIKLVAETGERQLARAAEGAPRSVVGARRELAARQDPSP